MAARGETETLKAMFDILENLGETMPQKGFLLSTSRFNHISTVRLLLERHPASRGQVHEALIVAERLGRAGLLRTIISTVPESFVTSDGWIERATTRRACTPIVKVLLDLHNLGTIQVDPKKMLLDALLAWHTRAVKHLLPIAASEGTVRTMRNLLRSGLKREPLVDVHEGDDAVLIAAVEASMLTSATFLLSHGARVGTKRGRALKVAERRRYEQIVDAFRAQVNDH